MVKSVGQKMTLLSIPMPQALHTHVHVPIPVERMCARKQRPAMLMTHPCDSRTLSRFNDSQVSYLPTVLYYVFEKFTALSMNVHMPVLSVIVL